GARPAGAGRAGAGAVGAGDAVGLALRAAADDACAGRADPGCGRAGRAGPHARQAAQGTAPHARRTRLVMLASVVLLLGGLLQQGAVQVRASLSDDRIAVGATTMLQVTVEADGGRPADIEVPALPPSLDVLSSREYLQTQLSLPGARTTIVRRGTGLRPRAEGQSTTAPG